MIAVKDLKELDLDLPTQFLDVLPERCSTCGAPTEISETLTGLRCCNPRCYDKVIMRIKAMLDSLGVKGFGEKMITGYVLSKRIINPAWVFGVQSAEDLGLPVDSAIAPKVIESLGKVNRFTLSEYVQAMNLPGIQDTAKKVFGEFNDLREAYKQIEDGGIDYIQEKLGLSFDGGVYVQAAKVYRVILEYKEDLLDGLNYVNIVDNVSPEKMLSVVCSDKVGGSFSTKNDFYNYIKNRFTDYNIDFKKSVTKGIDCLVWAGADGSDARMTSKVTKVMTWNDEGVTQIPIMTANEFIEEMENGYFG